MRIYNKLSIDILLELRGISHHQLPISEKQYYLMRAAQANVSSNTFKRLDSFLKANGRIQLLYQLDRLYNLGARIQPGTLLLPSTIPSSVANAIFQKHPIFNCNINTIPKKRNKKMREKMYAVQGSGH